MSVSAVNTSPFSPISLDIGEVVHKWVTDEKMICLIRRADELAYVVKDCAKNVTYQGPIPLISGMSLEQLIDILVESEPKIRDGGLHFKPNHSARVCWFWEGKKIVLLEKKRELQKELSWLLIDRVARTTSQITNKDVILHAPIIGNCSYYFDRLVNPLDLVMFNTCELYLCKEYATLEEVYIPYHVKSTINFLSEQTLEHVEIENDRLKSITLKPVHIARSRLDPLLIVDRYRYAITLVNTSDDCRGHAVIIIEMMERGQYHMYKAHLRINGPKTSEIVPGVVRFDEIDPDKFEYSDKSMTRVVIKKKAEFMISSIKRELKIQEEGKVAVLFQLRGFGAIFQKDVFKSKELQFLTEDQLIAVHNCITWALSKLKKADIRFSSDADRWLFTSPKDYTNTDGNSTGNCSLL